MRRRPTERKNGPIGDRILKNLGYADQQMPETHIKIEIVRQALKGSVRQQEAKKFARKNYTRVGNVRFATWSQKDFLSKITGDFEESEFNAHAMIPKGVKIGRISKLKNH